MKVLYLHQYFTTPAGSSGIRSYEFARALIARGHEVTIFCLRYDGSVTGLEKLPYVKKKRTGFVDGIHVIEFGLHYSNLQSFTYRVTVFFRYAFGAIRKACRKRYDLVFATSTPLMAAIPGIAAHMITGKRFVFEVRDLWPELPRAMGVIRNPIILGLMVLLENKAYHSATRLIGLSPGIVEGISRHGIDKPRIAMIPNACDERLFNPSRKGEIELPTADRGNFTAIFGGTIGIANGIDAVLDAAEVLLGRQRTDITILLVGKGNRRGDLQERARRSGLTNCLFLDSVPKDAIAQMIASAGAGLMILADVPAFYYGTSPNKFFDYIASGIPVINNYPGWLADMITEYGCGFALAPGDKNAFADALCALADDAELRAEMGKRSFALSRKFLRSDLARQFCDVIEEAAFNVKKGGHTIHDLNVSRIRRSGCEVRTDE